jgi:hypothetical protein
LSACSLSILIPFNSTILSIFLKKCTYIRK